jgi:hypothetical protein
MNPFDEISLEKAQRIADRRNQRRRDRLPLFADDVPVVTAAQVQQAFRRHRLKFADCLRRLAECAEQHRGMVAALVTEQELQRLDERRLLYPDGLEYGAWFWRQTYQSLKGGT